MNFQDGFFDGFWTKLNRGGGGYPENPKIKSVLFVLTAIRSKSVLLRSKWFNF